MSLIKIFNYIRGYVCFSAEGGFCERFINLCTGEKIQLWDIQKDGNKIFAKTDIKGFAKLKEPAEKASMALNTVKKSGIPYLITEYYSRRFLAVGFALLFVIFPILSGRLWCITVTGNNAVDSNEIIDTLEKCGLKKGKLISKLDSENAVTVLKESNDKILWAAINFQGCFACVEIKEVIEPETKISENTAPSNIIACCDGELAYTEIYSGLPTKKIGSGFVKDEILVSGISSYKNQMVGICHSDAYLEAKTKHRITIKNEMKKCKKISKIKHGYRLLILNFSIPISTMPKEEKNSIIFDSESYLQIGKVILPFGIATRTKTVFTDCNIKNYDTAQINLMRTESFELEHLKILQRKITKTKNETIAEYVCLENVGRDAKINIKN